MSADVPADVPADALADAGAGADTPLDVLVIGAGLSGIGAAVHLRQAFPHYRLAILEGRERLGGTWDLFRYPGIRSDSDMHTLGYRFAPWSQAKAIADGPSILAYLREVAVRHGIEALIRYGHRVGSLAWDSATGLWTLDCGPGPDGQPRRLRARFVHACTGYYDYAAGYTPDFAGRAEYQGRVVHPQHWPQDLDWTGQRIVVIGSGATAVTLVPALAATAAHVTLLQRSPTYIVAQPSRDRIADGLRRVLPAGAAHALTRWKNVLLGLAFYRWCRRFPGAARGLILAGVRRALPPSTGIDVERHFQPRYQPWDQRLCVVPDGDLFRALRSGRASVVTDTIDRFTATGLRLGSGAELPADLVVTATGLQLQLLGGATVQVDGRPVEFGRTLGYRGSMFSDVPNLSVAMGYTNASWTLKADLTSQWLCRLLRHLDRRGLAWAVPRPTPAVAARTEPWIDFSSGYVQRALAGLPRQGAQTPWRLHQNYLRDLLMLRFGRIRDGVLEFGGRR